MSGATYSHIWEHKLLLLAGEAQRDAIPHEPAPISDEALLRRAHLECNKIISEHGKTFYLASALLAPDKRRAIRALYAFCRVCDDIVDCSSNSVESKAECLEAWKVKALSDSPPQDDLVATAWAATRQRYRIPGRFAEQLVMGVARDLHQTRYTTFDDLATYMYCVASTVGLMSMHVIGLDNRFREEEAVPYLVKLGVALQLTNILRDVGEDWSSGRIYLPSEDLVQFGLSEEDIASGQVSVRWRALMRFEIERNRDLYAQAWPGIAMFGKDGRFAVAAACGLYSAILSEIEANDYDVFTRRAHVSTLGKLRRLPAIWRRQR